MTRGSDLTPNDQWSGILAAAPPALRARWKEFANMAGQAAFAEFAERVLTGDTSAGRPGIAASALFDSGILIRVISDPELSELEEATIVAKAAARIDERVDAKLLTALTAASANGPHDIPPERLMRSLELIDAISDCRRLLTPLMKYVSMRDPKIRSKAVKLVARASQNNGWIESALSDSDPRIRSNVVEGLMKQMGPRAEPLLRRAMHDHHHRVATTALLGLAQLGDASCRETLERLAAEGTENQQRAAAWALSKLKEADAPPVEAPAATPSSEAPRPTA